MTGNCRTQGICTENTKSARVSAAPTTLHWAEGSFASQNQFHIEYAMVFTSNTRTRRLLCRSIRWRQRCEKVKRQAVDFISLFVFSITLLLILIFAILNFADFWQPLYSGRAVRVVLFPASMNHIYVLRFMFHCFEIVSTLVSPIRLCMPPKIWDSTWEWDS